LDKLREHDLFLKPEKCQFGMFKHSWDSLASIDTLSPTTPRSHAPS
jgi:hypothetical protein